jgi:hypothetical protein
MMSINLPLLAENPGDYFETARKEPRMEFTEVDGKTYINQEGNHRTCIARFYFYYQGLTVLHGVHKESYVLDHKFRAIFDFLKAV